MDDGADARRKRIRDECGAADVPTSARVLDADGNLFNFDLAGHDFLAAQKLVR